MRDSNGETFEKGNEVLCPLIVIGMLFQLNRVHQERLAEQETNQLLAFEINEKQRKTFDTEHWVNLKNLPHYDNALFFIKVTKQLRHRYSKTSSLIFLCF